MRYQHLDLNLLVALDVLLDELCLDESQLLSALRIFYSYRLFCSEKYVDIFVFFNHKQFLENVSLFLLMKKIVFYNVRQL